MRWPIIVSLFRGLLCGTIVIAHSHVPVLAQAAVQATSQADMANQPNPSASSNSENTAGTFSASLAELPDSPGTVLLRRTASAGSFPDAASTSGASVLQGQTTQSPTGSTQPPGQSGSGASASERSQALSGAAAKASDQRRTANCNPAPGAVSNGIVELKNKATDAAPAATQNAAANKDPDPASKSTQPPPPCPAALNPYQRFLNSTTPIPLTPRQKAYLAVHNFIDPGNVVTIIGTSAIAIASDSHTAYGPGWRGFGRNAGISFVQDATGDFFGTFLIPSIAREDPHYHRMPNASIPRRTLHAISRTVIAQSDDGRPMPNYATLLTYPITNEIANLYVPGIASNGPSTVERILTGYATDPIDNIITEFLPDLAKRVHVRVIFVQQIINQVAAGQSVTFP